METTAPAIFEIGFVLLVAAVAGWLARRAGLPAIPSELYAAILAAVVVTIAASTLLVRVGYARPPAA